jgi:hypothetical protein
MLTDQLVQDFNQTQQTDQSGDELPSAADPSSPEDVVYMVLVECDFDASNCEDQPEEIEAGEDEVPYC